MENLQCQYQLPVPPSSNKPRYRSLATTSDGQFLIAGGKYGHIYHLNFTENQLIYLCIGNINVKLSIYHLDHDFFIYGH